MLQIISLNGSGRRSVRKCHHALRGFLGRFCSAFRLCRCSDVSVCLYLCPIRVVRVSCDDTLSRGVFPLLVRSAELCGGGVQFVGGVVEGREVVAAVL